MTQEEIKNLLKTNTIKDIEFDYNEVTIVLHNNQEIVFASEYQGMDAHVLSVEVHKVERSQLGRVELD